MMSTTSPTLRRGLVATAAVLLAAAGPLAACGSDDDSSSGSDSSATENAAVSVSDVWARPGTTGGNTAIYMELTGGDEDDELVGASVPTDVATEAQIHETVMAEGDDGDAGMTDDSMADGDAGTTDDSMADGDAGMTDDSMADGEMEGDSGGSGMMSMQEVGSIEIPAGGSVTLEPGGFHVMVLDLAEDLVVGDSVDVTLSFANGATQSVTAEVREP